MKQNQIKIKKLQNNKITLATVKNGLLYDAFGKRNIYCGCTGKTPETATLMRYKDGEVYCPHCHEKKVEVLQTYEEWKQEEDEKQRKLNEEKLQSLHLVERGHDWECGFIYYGLSANIEYEYWLKVKKYFKYHKRGWSNGQELEWEYGEPTGWLTRNPKEVEKILVESGLIKPENTMEAINERKELEKKAREEEKQAKAKEREEIKEKMDEVKNKIQEAFDNSEKRELSDAEANEYYFNPTYGKGTVTTYTITDECIVKVMNMADFKHGISVPYSKDLTDLIIKYHELNDVLWDYQK